MIIKSLLTKKNLLNSTEDLKKWIEQRNREVTVKVEQIPFSHLNMWHSDSDGSLHHDSGRFFYYRHRCENGL